MKVAKVPTLAASERMAKGIQTRVNRFAKGSGGVRKPRVRRTYHRKMLRRMRYNI